MDSAEDSGEMLLENPLQGAEVAAEAVGVHNEMRSVAGHEALTSNRIMARAAAAGKRRASAGHGPSASKRPEGLRLARTP